MLMRMIYDDRLAQAAYLIGCQRTGEAIVIDPERDVDRYLDLAKREGLRIVASAETHIHADFLSGARELAERTGARAYLSDEGDADWKYLWPKTMDGKKGYEHRLLKNGDAFVVGNIEFRVLHTPGHTPEHICFLVVDKGSGATEPMAILSGDFIFVGDLGRPDLLETAAGQTGAAEPSARRLFASVKRFMELPDYLQVWPAHGAGSACGKALGAVPQSTVGYEKRFNPAIRAAEKGEQAFVDFILEGQPEPPLYFARMKRENKTGPAVLGQLARPRTLSAAEAGRLDGRQTAILDTRTWKEFMGGHLPGSLYTPLGNDFTTVAGSYVEATESMYLVVDPARAEEAVRDLARIGLDRVEGVIPPGVFAELRESGGTLSTGSEVDVEEAKRLAQDAFLLDVRRKDEFGEGHLPGAKHIPHTRLAERLSEVPKDRTVLVNCRSGGRSARAVALLQRAGVKAVNLGGGFTAWHRGGGGVEK
ncbi:MAG: rhodanese-like domain-containing protein [Phycisphaerales bacterium]